jgi:SAM-dependent methyltransferase
MSECPVCHSPRLTEFSRVKSSYLDREERYEIALCQDCGHGHAIGRNDDDFLRRIYSDSFHDTSQQSTGSGLSPIERNAAERTAWLKSMRRAGRVMDVGAGKGSFVEAASTDFQAEGIELSEAAAAAAAARGVPVVAGDFLALSLPDGAFNVVTFWDVLASLKDPGAALDRAGRCLEPDGIVVATLPMIDSVTARTLRRFWPLLIPPVNLQYFSHRSIGLLAVRHGLELVTIDYPAKQVALSFVLAKAARSLRLFSLGSMLGARMPHWPVPINTGDIARVVLRRTERTVES